MIASRSGNTVRLALALLGVLGAATPSGAQSLADTDDALDGQRYLVRADDLVVADPYPTGSSTEVQYVSLLTEDMVITSPESTPADPVLKAPCAAASDLNTPFPQQTQLMRLFDLSYDVVVTLAPASSASAPCAASGQADAMDLYVDDPSSGERQTISVGGLTNAWLHTAVADFNGDGFDDLFILSDKSAYVATANDPATPSAGVAIRSSLELDKTPMADPAIGDFNHDGNLDVAWIGASFTSGAKPVVHFATVCIGPLDGTVCAGATSFTIRPSSATISPSAPTGSIVAVGGKCTQNDNNQTGNELRAPPMAVAAGQFDASEGSDGAELVLVALYEDSGNECKVVAESYRFTQLSGSAGQQIVPTQAHLLDNLGPHNDIGLPSAIFATAGRLNWSADTDNVAVAISSAQNHNVLVISLDSSLLMTMRHHSFSTGNNKSFAGLAIGRFSSAPTESTTSCETDDVCTDDCNDGVCDISGFDCSADGDCTGTCTSDHVCSYIEPNNYDLQVAAFLMARSPDHTSDVYIYSAAARDDFEPKQLQLFTVEKFVQPAMNIGWRGGSLLRAGDLQARSQRLGTPQVIRIEGNVQPDMILGVPPMHADWLPFGDVGETQYCDPEPNNCKETFSPSNICNCTDLASNSTCADGTPLRCLFNVSSLAGAYTSQFEFDDSETNQSEKTETFGWGLSASLDLSGKAKGVDDGLEETQELKFSADNTYQGNFSKKSSGFKTTSFNAATSTGFYDHVWYTARDYNVFYYPVIGQTVCVDTCQESGTCSISGVACDDDADCPNDFTDCPDEDKQQVYVQYAGASTAVTASADGGPLEWYQPVHEPGQILSYPWDCTQLAARNEVNVCDENGADYTLLSQAASFDTDTTEQEYSLDWKGGGERSQTLEQNAEFSQKLTYTTTASTPAYEESEEGLKFKTSVSVGLNESIELGQTKTSSFDSSTGITIKRPGTFLTPGKFAYRVDGYIFGDAPAPGTAQDLPPTSAEIQTSGVLRSAFTVDPRATGVGTWWQTGPYNRYIDVALNRPMHVKPDPGVGFSDPALTNCLPTADDNISTDDCVDDYPADPTPHGLFSSQYYWLRGFFITQADEVGLGPQLQMATEGDVLALQVRVYNYSLQDMNLGTIKVDFYAQEWDPQCNTPAGYYDHDQTCTQPGGGLVPCQNSCDPCCIANEPVDSIYIGRDVLDPLHGFNSPQQPDAPNWTVATTTFDTGAPSLCGSRGCGDKDFLFWVVTWPELADNSGNPALREELPDHSLTRIPGRLGSIADICTKDNSCSNGTCRATGGSCTFDADCPSEEDNTCGSDGQCAVSGTECTSDEECGECLCEVCLDEFSNNVGFYRQAFVIRPPTPEGVGASQPVTPRGSGAGARGALAIEHVTLDTPSTQPGDSVVVRAGLRAVGAEIHGQMVRFYAVPPGSRDLSVSEVFAKIRPFDVDILSRIRADRVHEAQAPFSTRETGTHEILVSALLEGEETLLGSASLEVGTSGAPTPTVTPTSGRPQGGGDDGSCAISTRGGASSKARAMFVLFPILMVLLRSRHVRRRLP